MIKVLHKGNCVFNLHLSINMLIAEAGKSGLGNNLRECLVHELESMLLLEAYLLLVVVKRG